MRQDLLIPGSDFEPTDIANIAGWWRGDMASITLGSVANVVRWADRSGDGNHLTQIDGASCPQFSASIATLNNRPGLVFSADDLIFFENAVSGIAFDLSGQDKAYTIFMAVEASLADEATQIPWALNKSDDASIKDISYFSKATATSSRLRRDDASATATSDAITAAYANPTILVDVFDGGVGGSKNTTQYIGAIPDEDTQAFDVGVATFDQFTIGSGNGAIPAAGFSGNITEVIAFARALFDAEINQIANYLAARYGLDWTNLT